MATNVQPRAFTPVKTWRSRYTAQLTDPSNFDAASSVILLSLNRIICVEKITMSVRAAVDEVEITELTSSLKIISKQKSILKETAAFNSNVSNTFDSWIVDLRQPTRKNIANTARPGSPPDITYINEFDLTEYLKDEYQIFITARVEGGSGGADREVIVLLEGYEFILDARNAKLVERLRQ